MNGQTRVRLGVAGIAVGGLVVAMAAGCSSSSASPEASGDDASLGSDATAPDGANAADGGSDASVGQGGDSGVDAGLAVDGGDAASDAAQDDGSDAAVEAAACEQVLSDAQAVCSQLCNTAPVVHVVYSMQTPPTAAGGQIVPGLYYLTAQTDYFASDAGVDAGVTPVTIQQTSFVNGAAPVSTMESVFSANGGPNMTIAIHAVTSGSSFYLTETCPNPGQAVMPYTASGNQLHVFSPGDVAVDNASTVSDEVFTLQTAYDAGAPSADSGASDADCAQPLSDAQVACNAVCNGGGSTIPVTGVVGVPVTPSGGAIPDGTYLLTSKTEYEGADAGVDGGTLFTTKETLVVSTSNGVTIWQDVQSVNGGANETITLSAVVQSPNLYLTGVCPEVLQAKFAFTMNGNQLVVDQQRSQSIEESVFEKL